MDTAAVTVDDLRTFLLGTPFFEGLGEEHMAAFADHAQVRHFEEDEQVFGAGETASAFYVLLDGKVRLTFGGSHPGAPATEERVSGRVSDDAPSHTISHPGHAVGWSSIIEPYRYRATAVARAPTRMVAFDREFVDRYSREQPQFGLAFMRRILWLVGGHLRAARMALVAGRFDDETRAIRALLEQSSATLSVTSALHKVPHYLDNRLTLDDAFSILDRLQAQGDDAEREVAVLAANILEGVRQELTLFQLLQEIYEAVASAPEGKDPRELRTESCRSFGRLFRTVGDHRIEGRDRLPSTSGHIFVMNHLSNHLDNLLPNDFILTLDTHFVSAMLLYEAYGEAPIRVIRKSRPDEHGHQRFYDRLGYIYVYSGHVDTAGEDPQSSPEERRRLFFDTARDHLQAGRNVVICPEGSSTETENSPLPFKAGAFRLARYVDPEPLVVPIAVANFDQKVTRTTTVTVVHEPIRLSAELGADADDQALKSWLEDRLHPRYEAWVREAVELSGG